MEKPKSNKTKIIIIVIAVIIVIAALAIVLPLSLRKRSKSKTKAKNALSEDKRTLIYIPENYISTFYSIVDKNNSFQILEKLQVVCPDSVESSCSPITNDTKEINDKEEIKNLTTLFDQVFNSSIKEKVIKENELIDEQKEVINSIFKKNGIIIKRLKYEILNNTIDDNSKYPKKGYYIEKINNTDSVILTISMGKKYIEGYSLKIKNIEIMIDEEYVFIYLEDNSSEPELIGSGTDPIAYPCPKIKFSKKPGTLIITNENTNERLNEVEDNPI